VEVRVGVEKAVGTWQRVPFWLLTNRTIGEIVVKT
jgi:hypothetical protein